MGGLLEGVFFFEDIKVCFCDLVFLKGFDEGIGVNYCIFCGVDEYGGWFYEFEFFFVYEVVGCIN